MSKSKRLLTMVMAFTFFLFSALPSTAATINPTPHLLCTSHTKETVKWTEYGKQCRQTGRDITISWVETYCTKCSLILSTSIKPSCGHSGCK